MGGRLGDRRPWGGRPWRGGGNGKWCGFLVVLEVILVERRRNEVGSDSVVVVVDGDSGEEIVEVVAGVMA